VTQNPPITKSFTSFPAFT